MNLSLHPASAPSTSIRRSIVGLLLASVFAAASAHAADSPSLRHTFFMRGHIVDMQDAALVVCIGQADGASVGQTLDVVRHRRASTGPKGMGRFKREVVGQVRIDAIVDEHYAEATLVSGEAGQHDSVELISARE